MRKRNAQTDQLWNLAGAGNKALLSLIMYGLFATSSAFADSLPRGSYYYASISRCLSDKKLDPKICRQAAANAEAEFDEKMPAFPKRESCEALYGRGRCSITFQSGLGGRRGRSGVAFGARQDGFRITVRSDHDAFVVPVGPQSVMSFTSRTILRPVTSRSAKIKVQVQQMLAARNSGGGGAPAAGVAIPGAPSGPLPPPPVFDPNFNCSALVDAKPGEDPRTLCFPARKH